MPFEPNPHSVSQARHASAVAEAVVNAVAHRDYASNASVQVMLFSDRLEVWNPGELPASLTPDRLTRPHTSIPRNPLVANPLFLAGYAEHAGTGTLDMIARCREAGLKTPEFRQDGGSFVQTIWRPAPAVIGLSAPKATGQAVPPVTRHLATALQAFFAEPRTSKGFQDFLGLRHRETFLDNKPRTPVKPCPG